MEHAQIVLNVAVPHSMQQAAPTGGRSFDVQRCATRRAIFAANGEPELRRF